MATLNGPGNVSGTAAAGSRGRVLLVANTGWYLYNFRRALGHRLREEGYEPVFLAPADRFTSRLEQEGFRWEEIELSRHGTNPWHELRSVAGLTAIYRREHPVLVHHFTIKCVIYGTLAARLARVPHTLNAITGLGHVFLERGWRARMLRLLTQSLYRFVLRLHSGHVIFQNGDDLKIFRDLGLLGKTPASVIPGSGIDTERFSPANPPANAKDPTPPPSDRATDSPRQHSPVVLFVGRLIREKGINEFLEAARLLHARGSQARFVVAGEIDPGNPSSLTRAQVDAEAAVKAEARGADRLVEFLGHVEEIANVIRSADIVVLPSYREGVPRVLLEAAAMGKAMVATDVPGCREVVEHGVNGRLVPARDPAALAEAIRHLLEHPEVARRMGQRGREKVVREFSETRVLASTLEVYQRLAEPRL